MTDFYLSLFLQDKELGVKILEEFSSVTKTLDDVYKKASDAKKLGGEAAQNSEVVIKKVDKIKKLVEDTSTKSQVSQMETGIDSVLKSISRIDFEEVVDSVKSLKRSIEKLEPTKIKARSDRHSSRGKRHSDSEGDAAETTRRRSRSSSNDVTIVSVTSGEKRNRLKRKKSTGKKRSRSSSTSSEEGDVPDEKMLSTMEKNVTKLLGTVDDMESR